MTLGFPALPSIYVMGPQSRGTPFGGPHSKDDSILGSTLESHYFGKVSYVLHIYIDRIKNIV